MRSVRSNLLQLPAFAAALALVLGAWSPAGACGCSPVATADQGCGAACCAERSLCQSCCQPPADSTASGCVTDGGCLCHPVSTPVSEQPRVVQAAPVLEPAVLLPATLLVPELALARPLLATASTVAPTGADLRVLYCSRLE